MEASALDTPRTTIAGARRLLLKPLRLQTDEGLVILTRGGHPAAFDHLVRRYQPRLLAFCRQMLRSHADAEDLVQETFVAALGAIHRDEREIHVRPWLYRIARNRCLNHLRNSATAGSAIHEHGVATLDPQAPRHAGSAADLVAGREELLVLVHDIQQLPKNQHSALVLHELHGLSYDEVASTMQTTLPGVKSLLVRARISLVEAAEARELTCDQVRVRLAERSRRLDPPVRRHLKACDGCSAFKLRLRSTSQALTALAPVWPLVALKSFLLGKLGAGATGAGTVAAGTAGSSAIGWSSGPAAFIAKAAVGLATVTAVATGVPSGALPGERLPKPTGVPASSPPDVQAPARAHPGASVPPRGGEVGRRTGHETQTPAATAPPARIVSTSPDGLHEGAAGPTEHPVPSPSVPRERPVPEEISVQRTRPVPGAPDQTGEQVGSLESESAPAEPTPADGTVGPEFEAEPAPNEAGAPPA